MLRMSVLDNNYYELSSALGRYLRFGGDENYHEMEQAIIKDISQKHFMLHQHHGLTTDDLQNAEDSISVNDVIWAGDDVLTPDDTDLEGEDTLEQETNDDTVRFTPIRMDDDGNMRFDASDDKLPMTERFPNVAKIYKYYNLEPRGPRTPLFDALEQALSGLDVNEERADGKNHAGALLSSILLRLYQVREAAKMHYETHIDPKLDWMSDERRKQAILAEEQADNYILKALNGKNTPMQGNTGTARDYLCRRFGVRRTEKALSELPLQDPSMQFFGQMEGGRPSIPLPGG